MPLPTAILLRPKNDDGVGTTKRGKQMKWMAVLKNQGIPLRNHLGVAFQGSATLLEKQ